MKYGIRWRRAFAISFLIHVVLLSGIGYMAFGLLNVPQQEDYVEMDLMNEPTAVEQIQQVNPLAVSQPTAKAEAPAIAPTMPNSVSPAVVPTAVTATVAAEISDVVAAAPAASGSTNTTTNDSVAPSGGGISAASGGAPARGPRSISPPRILQKNEPRYPEQERRDGVQGTVSVKIEILENGQPGRVWVQRSSGNDALDESSLSTVQNWRFIPARDTDSGQAIRCYTVVSVVFRLN